MRIVVDGIPVSNMTIYPIRILSGLILFCLLYLLFRAVATMAYRQALDDESEEDKQVAMASLLTYTGAGIAIFVGLLVAGFDFTGLAIVAGALSVGIGLGLQSVVNNFVSGLILLIEKPIKPGDRINIDGIEGFVKKIRVRSTHIISLYREDIIIPNSDLITHRLTNYMFSDKLGRFSCEVGVAYDSDAEQVRELLLQLAYEHKDVVKTGAFKPIVYFKTLDDTRLVFQLWCLIQNVNNKAIVQSDINFAIYQTFRDHGIIMLTPIQLVAAK